MSHRRWTLKRLARLVARHLSFRPGQVYLLITRSGTLVKRRKFGYVGQTRQSIRNRLYGRSGHMVVQPWAHEIVHVRILYSSRWVTSWGLDIREWFWIQVLWPLYNDRMNRANPRRVTPWRMPHARPVTRQPTISKRAT